MIAANIAQPGFLTTLITVMIVALLLLGMGAMLLLTRCFRKPASGQALVRNGVGGTRVSFQGMFVIPLLHAMERVDITLKRLTYERKGKQAILFKDDVRVELIADLAIRVNKESRDVQMAVSFFGVRKMGDMQALRDHFAPAFHETIEAVACGLDFPDDLAGRNLFREEVLKQLGRVHHGFTIDDLALHHLEKLGHAGT